MTAVFGPSGSGKTTLLRSPARVREGQPRPHLPERRRLARQRSRCRGAAAPAPRRLHLPGRPPVPAPRCRGQPRLRGSPEHAGARRRGVDHPRRRPSTRWTWSRCSTGDPARCPAVSASGPRWDGPCSAGRACLLLDEPLSALDRRRKAEIMPYLLALHPRFGIPTLYVSHAVDEVALLADRVLVLADRPGAGVRRHGRGAGAARSGAAHRALPGRCRAGGSGQCTRRRVPADLARSGRPAA